MTRKGQELHRFPPGQRCDECRAKRWYAESGHRYCQNGHRIEGYVEFDIDEEDNFGQLGKIVRKKRAPREKMEKHLTGQEAEELYLECLQLILWKQVRWLVHTKNLPSQLETVVRDFWHLRLRDLDGLTPAAADETSGQSGMESGIDSGTELFSSQAGTESDASATIISMKKTASSFKTFFDWNKPKLIHTLAICYLGCLSMSLDVRVGQIYNWAKDNRLPYHGAFDSLPSEMKAALPGPYHSALKVHFHSFCVGQLQGVVLELVQYFHLHFKMVFPPLNMPLLLVQYLQELGLPPMIYVNVRAMARQFDWNFTFDMGKEQFKPLDHPDILLVACIVYQTKLWFPFDGLDRFPRNDDDPASFKIDWNKWRELMTDPEPEGLERHEMRHLRSEDAWTMSDKKIDDYLDWYEETQIKTGNETSELAEMFPLPEKQPQTPRPELTEDEIEERLKLSQTCLSVIPPVEGDNVRRLGDDHALYRTVEDLSDVAKAFYNKAAGLSGLTLHVLVKAVYSLDMSVSQWQKAEQKKQREGSDSQ